MRRRRAAIGGAGVGLGPAVVALWTTAACIPPGGTAVDLATEEGISRRLDRDIAAARELDQQGVRAFREARWGDALHDFDASYRLGGPPSELWNVARCRERLDDPEGAVAAIDRYLSSRSISPADRAEGERERQALRARPSILTVATRPPGAVVIVDGRPADAPSPVSLEIAPGRHTVAVRRDGYVTETRPLEARLGRALILLLELARASDRSR